MQLRDLPGQPQCGLRLLEPVRSFRLPGDGETWARQFRGTAYCILCIWPRYNAPEIFI